MSDFEKHMQHYAEVVIKLGINVQPGQRVLIMPWVDNIEFVRALTGEAYKAGASYVDVLWEDETARLTRFEKGPADSLAEVSDWRKQAIIEAGERGDAVIRMNPPDPTLLLEQDPDLVQVFQKAQYQLLDPWLQLVRNRGLNWVGIGVPNERWAAKLLPDVPAEERIRKMWEIIFRMCRISTTDDPMVEWERHIAQLKARSDHFNQKKYTALKLNAPGTDLWVGLPEGQHWLSAQMVSKAGVPSVVNIPTE